MLFSMDNAGLFRRFLHRNEKIGTIIKSFYLPIVIYSLLIYNINKD